MRRRLQLYSGVFSFALLLSLCLPTPSPGLQFHSAPARFWGYTYRDSLENLSNINSRNEPPAVGESKSEWKLNLINVPEEAKSAIKRAINIWSDTFSSKVPVTVDVIWEREQNSSILGSARPGYYFNSFPGSPDDDLWYPSSLANSLAGKDLDPNQSEIVLKLNSSIFWYLGIDGKPGKQEYDLSTVVLHEIGHGLGFLSNTEYDRFFGTGYLSQPTPYDAFVQLPDGRTFLDFCSQSIELGKAMVGELYWSGSKGIAANNGDRPTLYSPPQYLEGSSITHLDESRFSNSLTDALMTPNLGPGESFNQIGPIALGMIEDMMTKPSRTAALQKPEKPLNVRAFVGDQYAIVAFDTSSCRRIDQVTGFRVMVIPGGWTKTFTASPARITGLKNGTSYKFSVSALNERGISEPVISNSIKPESGGKMSLIDPLSQVTYFASTTWRKFPTLVYADELSGQLKIATYKSSRWSISKIRDGVRIGSISVCKSGSETKEALHIVYADLQNKDVVHGYMSQNKWKFEIVDGNGEYVQEYSERYRVRTAADVSTSNACVATENRLQVFYRDDTQGILLGAVKTITGWTYEVIDGDSKKDGRTTGDVAFHLVAESKGNTVYLFYDSVLTVTANNSPTQGEVRLARRETIYPEDWQYKTLDGLDDGVAVAGFSVAIARIGTGVGLSWLSSAGNSLPNADRIKFASDSNLSKVMEFDPINYGTPQGSISLDNRGIVFRCEGRLCKTSTMESNVKLANGSVTAGNCALLTINQKRVSIVTIRGKLSAITL